VNRSDKRILGENNAGNSKNGRKVLLKKKKLQKKSNK
jgi:hypothetical protein